MSRADVLPLAGRVLAGRYRLVRQLGAGGMGAVYCAIDERLGGEVAVKVIREGDDGSGALARFRREARAAAALGNPHIVRVTDFQENADEPAFIVMEKVDGVSLSTLVKAHGRLAPSRACTIAAQILHALAAAHAAGIIHRDIKPANVMVSSTPAGDLVKVVDFGLAGLVEAARGTRSAKITFPSKDLTSPNDVLGTMGYVAPEHLRGELTDGRADVYAVGATLFFMLSGRNAFASAADALAGAIDGSPRLDVEKLGLQRALADVVARAMALQPDDRHPSAGALIAALEPWTSHASPSWRAPDMASTAPEGPTSLPAATLATATNGAPRSLPTTWERARFFVLAGALVAFCVMLSEGCRELSSASIPKRRLGPKVESRARDSDQELK